MLFCVCGVDAGHTQEMTARWSDTDTKTKSSFRKMKKERIFGEKKVQFCAGELFALCKGQKAAQGKGFFRPS